MTTKTSAVLVIAALAVGGVILWRQLHREANAPTRVTRTDKDGFKTSPVAIDTAAFIQKPLALAADTIAAVVKRASSILPTGGAALTSNKRVPFQNAQAAEAAATAPLRPDYRMKAIPDAPVSVPSYHDRWIRPNVTAVK